jgi:hypothetical protein
MYGNQQTRRRELLFPLRCTFTCVLKLTLRKPIDNLQGGGFYFGVRTISAHILLMI